MSKRRSQRRRGTAIGKINQTCSRLADAMRLKGAGKRGDFITLCRRAINATYKKTLITALKKRRR